MLNQAIAVALLGSMASVLQAQPRKTARELGVVVGVLPTGPLNAITDIAGVREGQETLAKGDSINTGVTAILPHGGNIFREKVPGAVVIGNAFGKLAGSTQVNELGELESPVVLTCTLCVPRAADAVLTYLLGLPGNEDVRSANPVVGETNDGGLNDIRRRPITEADVLRAIATAKEGPVEQGSVGAGRGTRAFGWKGGIGTSSRKLPDLLGGWTVGVLVQSNYGGILQVAGAPVGIELGNYYLREQLMPRTGAGGAAGAGGAGANYLQSSAASAPSAPSAP
ncbi:MAG: P1 family peptidase, partial [Gemmatimonadetes bacterium]|nr:P1 family peptidase [Gemmatimonadota bacterium]